MITSIFHERPREIGMNETSGLKKCKLNYEYYQPIDPNDLQEVSDSTAGFLSTRFRYVFEFLIGKILL